MLIVHICGASQGAYIEALARMWASIPSIVSQPRFEHLGKIRWTVTADRVSVFRERLEPNWHDDPYVMVFAPTNEHREAGLLGTFEDFCFTLCDAWKLDVYALPEGRWFTRPVITEDEVT